MPVHFSPEEMQQRRGRAASALNDAGLDGLLVFKQESMYWLTGYETFGYAMFQCLVLGADGSTALLTRLPDLRQAEYTSDLKDIRLWNDRAGVNPGLELKDMLADLGFRGKRLGVEYESYGLTAANGKMLEAALDGFCDLSDASTLITLQRRIKSPRELEYLRRAAALSDDALDAAIAETRAGAFEGDILAAMQGAVFKGGGDYAGNEFIIGSGPSAMLVRYHSDKRQLDEKDQLTLEWSGAYRRYHAAMIRTLVVGEPSDHERRMFDSCHAALLACEEAVKPGNAMHEVFDAYAQVNDAHGFENARFVACGYGMGAVFNPIWVDFPMFYEGNDWIMEESSVFFLHMILMDREAGLAMTLGHSVEVTAAGCRRLSRHPLELAQC